MKASLVLLVLGLTCNVFAQNTITRNNVFAETNLALNIFSVNYERLLLDKTEINYGLRAGASYFDTHFVLPLSFSMIKELQERHYLDIRLSLFTMINKQVNYLKGDTTAKAYKKTEYYYGIGLAVGHRYQPVSKGLFFTSMIHIIPSFSGVSWQHNLSLGIGYAF